MSHEGPRPPRSRVDTETLVAMFASMTDAELASLLETQMRERKRTALDMAMQYGTGDVGSDERLFRILKGKDPGFVAPIIPVHPEKSDYTESQMSTTRHAFEQMDEGQRTEFMKELLKKGNALSAIVTALQLTEEEQKRYLSVAAKETDTKVKTLAPPPPARPAPPPPVVGTKQSAPLFEEERLPSLSEEEYDQIRTRLLAEGFTEKTIERGFRYRVVGKNKK